jgi:hypothetical protein
MSRSNNEKQNNHSYVRLNPEMKNSGRTEIILGSGYWKGSVIAILIPCAHKKESPNIFEILEFKI